MVKRLLIVIICSFCISCAPDKPYVNHVAPEPDIMQDLLLNGDTVFNDQFVGDWQCVQVLMDIEYKNDIMKKYLDPIIDKAIKRNGIGVLINYNHENKISSKQNPYQGKSDKEKELEIDVAEARKIFNRCMKVYKSDTLYFVLNQKEFDAIMSNINVEDQNLIATVMKIKGIIYIFKRI